MIDRLSPHNVEAEQVLLGTTDLYYRPDASPTGYSENKVPDLFEILRAGPVDSKATRAGWVGINFSEPQRDVSNRKLRMTISTAFDPDEVVELNDPAAAPVGEISTIPSYFEKGQTNVDLSRLERIRFVTEGFRIGYPPRQKILTPNAERN